MFNKKFFCLVMLLSLISFVRSDELVTGELIFKLYNMPQHSILLKIQAQDNVFDENKLYTTQYQGKTLYIDQSATAVYIDFCSDPSAGTVDTIGYSFYKIRIGNSIVYMDYRDCNFKYPGLNWDVTFYYYYDTGKLLWKSPEGGWIDFNGYVFEIWRTRPDYPVYDPDISCFRPAVLLQNQFEEQSFGRLEVDDYYFVATDAYERFDWYTNHTVMPEFQKYLEGSGVSGKDLQHHDWNEDYEDYIIVQDFYVNGWLSAQRGWFDELRPCTLKTELISGGSGVKVGVKDPWLIEQDGSQPNNFHSYNSPFVPADGYGAFLDQVPDPINPEKPYYAVRVPQDTTIQFHGEDIDRYFQQLALIDFWSKVRGIILGQFLHEGKQLDVVPLLKPLISNKIPLISNFPYGHQTNSFTLIQGVSAKIATNPFSLTWEHFIES